MVLKDWLGLVGSGMPKETYSPILIWDEVGESDEERDEMLLRLEQECLDVYKRKVEQASNTRALLLQSLADSKAELARLLSTLGEKSIVGIVSYIVLHRFQLTRDYLQL
ncbi:hypothetical protein B296_00038754 [Ensete ventricosum]|uniref:Uncharacterized protein n=1 Tax=Ensete ventricosum TaxID=4639 RepID=A0A426Y472_ENSVE|nr:hypothetical protein B296_00038754 [Ensete ventricosum]